MERVSDELKDLKTKEVIEKSHRELAWKVNNEEKKIISYRDYGFEILEM